MLQLFRLGAFDAACNAIMTGGCARKFIQLWCTRVYLGLSSVAISGRPSLAFIRQSSPAI